MTTSKNNDYAIVKIYWASPKAFDFKTINCDYFFILSFKLSVSK